MKSPRNPPPDVTKAWSWSVPTKELTKVANAKFATHIHRPPACTPTKHPSSCKDMGYEIGCVRYTKVIRKTKVIDICICNHFDHPAP
jgi:hypothetical protein